jgi:hypothetical protein
MERDGKYGKDEKRSAKICSCSRHVTKCDKNIKSPKSPIDTTTL